MGFFTRLIAGLVAASTLGAGLAGTAGTVDTTGATGDAKGVVKLASDDTTNGTVKTVADENVRYGSLANGDFSYPSFSDIQKNEQEGHADLRTFLKSDDGTLWHNMSATDLSKYGKIGQIPGFDSSRFAWSSTENGSRVELQQDRNTKNTYAEIVAQQDNTSIYQNVSTGNGGVLYKIRLKHASRQSSHADRMQVLVGSDTDHATPVEMTRVTSNGHGDKVGGKSTTITTKVSNTDPRDHGAQWETYEGYYQVPEGQKNTVFMFKSLEGFKEYETLLGNNIGNLVDDIEFSRSYKLTYDANSSDASGQVPSDTAANTVKQAKTSTTGTLRLASDDDVATYAASNLPEQIVNGGFDYPSVPSWTALPESGSNKYNKGKLFATINPGTGKYGSGCAMSTTGRAIPNWNRLNFAWNSTQGDTHHSGGMSCEAGNVELNYDSVHHNQFAELTADQQGTAIYQDVKVTPGTMMKWSLKHSSATSAYVDKMQVLIGEPYKETAQEATRITSENGNKVGEKMTTISTPTTSDRADNKKWDTYSGTYLVPDEVTTVRFTFKSIASAEWYSGNDLDDIKFSRSYQLSYDKNAQDASGQVPSNETANTVKQAKSKATGGVRLVDDETTHSSNLPKQLVNSDFDHDWRNIVGQSKMTDKYNFANVDPAHGDVEISGALNGKGEASKHWVHLNGFDAAKFGWKSNQTDTRVDGRGGIVEIQRSKANDNMYAEITASQANTYLYQDIDTAHDSPTVYTVKLRYAHRNGTVDSNEKIQILVGAPGHEQPVEMTRIASDRGNKVGEKSTTVNAPNTDGWLGSWDTFQGSVEIPAGQPVSRFTFKALGSVDGVTGNLIDDVQFKLAYPLSYDKNAQDATGSVPSSQYGKENTVQPAEAKTTGTVKTVADDDSSKSLTVNPGFDVPDYSKLNDGGLHWMYVSPAEGEAWSFYDYINPAQPRHQVAGLSQATFGWQELTGGDYKTTLFELHREKDGNVCADVHGSRTIGQTIDTQAGVAYTVSIRHSGRSKGNAGSVQVLVGPDKDHLRPLEMSRMNVSRTGAKYGDRIGKVGTVVTTHSDSVDSTEGDHPAWDHSDDWETYSGTYVATGGKTVFAYRGVDKNGNAVSGTDSGADSVIDDLSFKLAYPLAYDKNAADASGQVPSNTTQTASSKPTGKVSDLVQRTTTREDGSVTVKTIDTSTDVVSGCQVYYPAGQRITLATLAKDNDCWDSSMLTRPGHTQLGWSQDSQATQAQAEVTMVEGGMTVYAVWVGNPVLTYDTNKPNTWNGQMPSTPASVSVAYNTAAADGSGWQSGDTSKIRGYRFLGWYAGPQDDSGLYDWNTLLTGNVTVYAHWQRLQANVVYDANGGTGSHANTTGWQYSDVTVPSDTSKSFKRDGYVFLGWDTQADGNGTAYKDGSQVPLQDKDITLYAQWQPVFEQFTPTGGVSLPLLVAGGVTLLVMGIGSTVMLTRRMRGEQ